MLKDHSDEQLGPDLPATSESRGLDRTNFSFGAISGFTRSRIGKVLAALALIAAALEVSYLATRKDTDEIEMEHDGAEFTLEGMNFREKVTQLMIGSLYDSRNTNAIDNGFAKLPLPKDFSDWLSDLIKTEESSGGVHVFNSDAKTLGEAHRTIVELLGRSKIPPFVSMDVVGGYTRHLGLTREEAKDFGVPDRFLKLAEAENLALPTQESIGRQFSALKTVKERIEFRKEMEAYGAAISKLCKTLGISIDFAPVLDMVADIDGDNFMEKNDQTYGNNSYVVEILGFHFMKGFQSAEGVILSPKHFFGTGKSPNDPHKNEDQKVTKTKFFDGAVLPFKDAINGRLFSDGVAYKHKGDFESFDMTLRTYLREIDLAKRTKSNGKLVELRVMYAHFLDRYGLTVEDVPEDFMVMPRVPGMMVSHSQNVTNRDVPGTISPEMVRRRLKYKLGFRGIVFSDDLNMGALERYATTVKRNSKEWPAEVFTQSLAAGVTMPMLLHHSGEIDGIVARVKRAVETGEDFDGDKKPDITREGIDEAVRQVLEAKVRVGLLKKKDGQKGDGRAVYVNNSKAYLKSRPPRGGVTE